MGMDVYREVWRALYGWNSAPETQRNPELVAEALIDVVGLTRTIETLADICIAKAAHLEEAWPSDDNAATVKAYTRAAALLVRLAAKVNASALADLEPSA